MTLRQLRLRQQIHNFDMVFTLQIILAYSLQIAKRHDGLRCLTGNIKAQTPCRTATIRREGFFIGAFSRGG